MEPTKFGHETARMAHALWNAMTGNVMSSMVRKTDGGNPCDHCGTSHGAGLEIDLNLLQDTDTLQRTVALAVFAQITRWALTYPAQAERIMRGAFSDESVPDLEVSALKLHDVAAIIISGTNS